MKYISIFSIILAVISVFIAGYTYFDLRQTKCDISNGVYAEREYVYPILKDLGYSPDNYGKNVLNPITTKERYSAGCK